MPNNQMTKSAQSEDWRGGKQEGRICTMTAVLCNRGVARWTTQPPSLVVEKVLNIDTIDTSVIHLDILLNWRIARVLMITNRRGGHFTVYILAVSEVVSHLTQLWYP